MFDLKVFQSESALLIADRYSFFANHADRPMRGNKPRPYFQALSALTGAGKTPILAQAVALMRGHFVREPIVFWMSKAKSVVAQTYANFSVGGKYRDLVEEFRVVTASQLTPRIIDDGSSPLIVMATTGLFNNQVQSDGTLNIYKTGSDLFGDKSPWQRLIERKCDNQRRPLVIVYDEGHNLSEQQTNILAELEPDAYLLASATLKLPANFNRSVVFQIASWVQDLEDVDVLAKLQAVDSDGKPDAQKFITTTVSSESVVNAQLVKKAIQFDGTTAAMEKCVNDLINRMRLLTGEIDNQNLSFKPKAIYVCKTNITDDGDKDDPTKPFEHRNAPPIKIWRYLVEEKGISPDDIAIYANLSFIDGNKPDAVNLFSKGENDFETFTSGNFHHIIFNLSLQEGWDDPSCYFAYIDKSMGSSIQVEQVIGRVLRQYGALHYENPLLNSAHFFLRVDSQNVFTEAIHNVKEKLRAEGAPIEVVTSFGGGDDGSVDLSPQRAVALNHIHVDSESARDRINQLVNDFPHFMEETPDTLGQAQTVSLTVNMSDLEGDVSSPSWKADGHTNPIRLRWLINTAIKSRSNRALAVVDLSSSKFDVRVQVQSPAERYAIKLAADIVESYYQLSELFYEKLNPFNFGQLRVPKKSPTYVNSLYTRYAGLNKLEARFAAELDKVGSTWHRNQSVGGFFIPLLSEGDTANFFPDFIVWKGKNVYCLDTKGAHLLTDAVSRKLFNIQDDGKEKIFVRFISEGKQMDLRGKVLQGGFTVWKMKSGSPTPIHTSNLAAAVKECLK